MGERPGELRVDIEVEHATLAADLRHLEAVEAQQPVGLVEPVLAHQGRSGRRQLAARIGDRAEGGVIDPLQPVGAIEIGGEIEDRAVGRCVGADDHLRALAGRREAARMLQVLFRFRLVELQPQPAHGAADRRNALFRRQRRQPLLGRQLDIDRQPIGIEPRLGDQRLARLGNRLQVDVALEAVLDPQRPRHRHHLLHRVVGIADDAGGEEQAFDIVAAVEIERQLDDFRDGEAGARHVGRGAVDAIEAVEIAGIGQEHLQERDAAAVRRIGMADAHALGRADALAGGRVPGIGAARGAGRVILRRIRQNSELFQQFHRRHLSHVHDMF